MFIREQIPFTSHASIINTYRSLIHPDKPHILALHGFTGNGQDFEPVVQLTGEHCNWYSLDLPGHDPRNHPASETFSIQLCLDAINTVIEFYNLNNFILLGYSMGGRLALHYTLQHPTIVNKLVLIGASPGIVDIQERQERLEQDQKLSQWILKNDIKTFIDFWMQTPLIRSQKNIPSNLLKPFLERKYHHSPSGLAAALNALSPGKIDSLWAAIKTITCPTLIIASETDAPYIEIGQKMVTLLQNAHYQTIPQAGHCAHLENLPAFSKEFLNFCFST